MLQSKPKEIKINNLSDDVNLLIISDVHHAQRASDEDLLIHDLSQKLPRRLILGLGDELDSISRADHKRHRMEDLKDKFCTKDTYPRLIDAEIEDYAEILKKYTTPDEWLGHISGNHPLAMTEYGVDPVERLCILLKHVYLGYSAFVPVTLNYSHGHRVNLMIMCHHGFGGANARKEGSGLNNYIDHALRYEGWDLAAYGHRHDRWVKTVPRIRPQVSLGNGKNPWVRAVEHKIVQCGTYLRTLSHNKYPTYAEKFGYPPRPIGCLHLRIGIRQSRPYGTDRLSIEFRGSNE